MPGNKKEFDKTTSVYEIYQTLGEEFKEQEQRKNRNKKYSKIALTTVGIGLVSSLSVLFLSPHFGNPLTLGIFSLVILTAVIIGALLNSLALDRFVDHQNSNMNSP